MPGAGVGEAAGSEVEQPEKNRREHRLPRLLHDRHEAAIDLRHDRDRIGRAGPYFLGHAADERGKQARAHAVPHHVADEHAAACVGDAHDVEKVTAQRGSRHVTVGETEAVFSCAARERGIGTRQESFLDLPRHPQIRLHFLAAALHLLLGNLPPCDVVADTHEPDDLPVGVVQRNLGDERPVDIPVGAEIGLLHIDHGFSAEGTVVVGQRLFPSGPGKKIRGGAADRRLL